MGWTGALPLGLKPGHLSLWWLSWQGPGLPGCSGNQGTRGCQACWWHGGHTPGMGMRWDLGSGDGRCSSSLGLLLALTVPLDPSCSGLVLPPHRVHPGGLDAAERSCLFPTLCYTQMGIDPLSSSLGSGLLSLQLLSLLFTTCFSYLSSLSGWLQRLRGQVRGVNSSFTRILDLQAKVGGMGGGGGGV